MTVYPGNKSLDAEITLNFENGTVLMDYSLNRFGSPYQSNDSTILYNQYRNLQPIERLKEETIHLFFILLFLGLIPIIPIMTFLNSHQIVNQPNIQYKYQKYLRWVFLNAFGSYIQSKGGPLNNDELTFIIPNNLWVEYNLRGDYQEKVKSISLLRNFVRYMLDGKFEKIQQRGWKVVLKFKSPPQNGYCEIKCIRSMG
jgi:hypothetical protein